MNVLLAPNGKPSNLTPEQYKLVRTPAFKEWFGDWENSPETASKVVDENGEPLVVYHGTNVEFYEFDLKYFGKTDKGWYGKGFYFTPNKYFTFAKDSFEQFGGKEVELELFLNIKNPLYGEAYAERNSNLVGSAKDRDKDGVIVLYDYGHELERQIVEIVVWESNQIKLADGTNTTFDGNNPDIRYKNGGDVWDVDRYRQVEKEMYDLQQQGKTDSAEYFKLIKERSILERNKMELKNNSEENMNTYSTDKFAKGGKILVKSINVDGEQKTVHNDLEKFKRIGITDKYFIEASNDVGLQGVVFKKEELLKKITTSFNKLLATYEDYLINKDSNGITFTIENRIRTLQNEGASLESIERERSKITDNIERQKIIDEFANVQRQAIKQWVDYLSASEYDIQFKYLMFKAVLTFNYELSDDKLIQRTNESTRNIVPFDAGSLADLYQMKSNYLLKDYILVMNENSLAILNSKEIIDSTENGKWIKFNGGSKTSPQDIEKNGKELMQLVQNTYWCTKSLGTSQLRGGDFYVYVTEFGTEVLPQIAVRMNENEVGEVRGNVSSAQDLSAEMLPIAKKFLIKNIPNNSGKKWLDNIEYNQRCVKMRKKIENEGLYENFVFEYFDLISKKEQFKVEYGENGNVTSLINAFNDAKNRLPNKYYDKDDIQDNYIFLSPKTKYFIGNITNNELSILSQNNINLSDLSNWNLKWVSGNIDCSNVINNLGNIEYVGGNLTLSPNVMSFGSIKEIGGKFDMGSAQITTLENIETIGSGFVVNSNLRDLGRIKKIGWLTILSCDEGFSMGQLEEVKGDLVIKVTDKSIDLGGLKIVEGTLDLSKTLITEINNLEFVGKNFIIAGSKVKQFPNLKTINGNADFSNNFSSSTQNIETILGDVKFLNSRIMEFPKLTNIGGNIELRGSYFKSFGNIKSIGGNLKLDEGKVEELGNLEEINGFVSFEGTQIKSLNKLRKIVKFANFNNSMVEDLGDLESIGGNAHFDNTKIKSIGKLKYIGGIPSFRGNQALEEQWKKVKDAE